MRKCPFCGFKFKKEEIKVCSRCHKRVRDIGLEAVLWIFVKSFFRQHGNNFIKLKRIISELKRYNIVVSGQKLIEMFKRTPGDIEQNKTGHYSEWRLKE